MRRRKGTFQDIEVDSLILRKSRCIREAKVYDKLRKAVSVLRYTHPIVLRTREDEPDGDAEGRRSIMFDVVRSP